MASHSSPSNLQKDIPVRRADGLLKRRVADCTLLVPTVTQQVDLENLFLLNPLGEYVWETLGETGATPAALAESVTLHFEVTPEQALQDVEAFLDDLVSHGLAIREQVEKKP